MELDLRTLGRSASLVAVLASWGCGRIGFDTVGDGSPAGFERTISVTNASTTTLPAGFAVNVSLDAIGAAPLRPDLADVRVVSLDGTERDRVIDTNAGVPAALWFALASDIAPSSTDDRYLLLYGDPNDASAHADGTRVFAFYDDFTAPSLASAWQVQGAPQLGGGELRILAGTNGDGVASDPPNDGVPLIASFEIRARITDPASAPGAYYYWFGFQSGFPTVAPFTNWVARAPAMIHGEHASSTPPCDTSYCPGPAVTQTTAYRVFRIDRLPDRQVFWADGAIQYTVAQPTVVDQGLNMRNFAVTSDLVVDWVRARAMVDPEPTATLGPEQPR